jgi:hypothetical protein
LFFLTLNLIYIYIYSKNLEFKWLNKYLPVKYSNKIKILISKIYKIWNRNNKMFILIILIMLFISISSSTYMVYLIYSNFDKFIEIYLNYKYLN